MNADLLLPWVVTYLVHSTVLLGLVFLVTRLRALSSGARETLWRTAMFGGLLTATVASAFSLAPMTGTIAVPAPAPDIVAAVEPARAPEPDRARDATREVPGTPRRVDVTPPVVSGPVPTTGPHPAPAEAEAPVPVVAWLVGVWSLLVALSLAMTTIARRRFLRRVGTRTPVTEGLAFDLLEAVAVRAGVRGPVRLTTSEGLGSPVVLGVWEPEICVPTHALDRLAPEQMQALLAHELAHVVRRDGLWLMAARALVRLFPFQPLNRVALGRLRDTAEVLCDTHAVAWTERPLALAECLTEVAGWLVDRRGADFALAMAYGGSRLGDRVGRLLLPEAPRVGRRGVGRIVALAILAVVAVAAPAASLAAIHDAPARADEAATRGAAAPERAETPDTLASMLAALDAELSALRGELDTLVELAAQVDDPRVSAATERIEALMNTLRARRAALQSESDR